ncbi:probetacellulin isoform X1 [Megalops cyprinoides]|uniref:probetacellulin isoform X1 n=1 Tax=Megalops cyprinoides TaxID=118141 RepID=UPI0018653E2C|nr:probetacellulin isoform X1 [Megalops cyprinoides]
MEGTYTCRVFALFTAVALCKYSQAEWNATQEATNKSVSYSPHGNGSNHTVMAETAKWSGHFSKCPREFKHYCIHGKCRFVKEQNTPLCICPSGYMGHRCEYVDFDSRIGDQRQIIIACVIAALIFLILLIVFICICAHRHKLCRRRKKRKEEKKEEIEKLNMMSTSNETRENVSANAETSETNAV